MEAYSHLKSVVELKDEGNAEFRKGNLSRAVEKYKAALRKRETVSDEIRGSLQSNVAVCLVKLSRWEEAIEAATAAIVTLDKNPGAKKLAAKARVYRARARQRSEHRERKEATRLAVKDLEEARALDPKDKVIEAELERAVAAQNDQPVTAKGSPTIEDEDLLSSRADSKLGGALRKALGEQKEGLYDDAEASVRRRLDATLVTSEPEEGPPREWVLERMQEALERQKKASREDDDDDAVTATTSGYVRNADGGVTPSWSVRRQSNAPAADPMSESLAEAAKPVRVADGVTYAPTVDYNRGYKEIDVSEWCRRRLLARLRPIQASLVDDEVREGSGGIVRCSPVEASGEALVVRVGNRWDKAYDMSARFSFEAKVGAPRTAEVEMKGKKQRMFMGVPTVRGAIVVRELTHVEGPSEAVVELQWGYGGTELHFEKDEVGMTKEHASFLRAFLTPGEGTVHAAIIDMLRQFVEDFQSEIVGQPSARLADIPYQQHVATVAADEAFRAACLGVEILLPSGNALPPWKWEKPEPPKTTLEVAEGSKLDASNVQTQSTDDQTQYDEGDPRGGFSHKMMEQFESLHNQGYTVLLGESASDEKKKQSSAESSPPSTAIDYSKFDNVEDPSDDEAEEDVDELDDADARIKRLGPDTSRLWETILQLADGDPVKAQELMQDPDELQRHPAIAALYADGD